MCVAKCGRMCASAMSGSFAGDLGVHRRDALVHMM